MHSEITGHPPLGFSCCLGKTLLTLSYQPEKQLLQSERCRMYQKNEEREQVRMHSQERTHQCTCVSRGTGCKCHFSRVCELKTADQKIFKALSAFSPHQAVVKGQQQTGLLTITAILMKGKNTQKTTVITIPMWRLG